jgi:hypothetical protein
MNIAQRELFKQCMLAVQYGMEWKSLALRVVQPQIVARDLLRAHRLTYRQFWAWSDAAVDQAMLVGVIHTVFGWPIRVAERSNPRSLRNFPMQANGAEMLRIACCLATERGVEVCAPVHDAVLIYAPLDRLAAMRAAMAEASRLVLAGFELATDVKVVPGPIATLIRAASKCGTGFAVSCPRWNRTKGHQCMSRKFTKFPKMWQLCLEKKHAGGSMYRVALYLLDKAAFSEQVTLGNRVLEKYCVSQASK